MTRKLGPADAAELFRRGTLTLARMQHFGIRVDVGYLTAETARLTAEIDDTETRMRGDRTYKQLVRLFGDRANIQSRDQLGKLLFSHMGLEPAGATATGRARADKAALDGIDLPYVKDFLRTQKLKKARDTYLKGLLREQHDGIVHPTTNLHTAATFRSSMSDPNLQNVPVRDKEIMQIVRRAFVPRPGNRLVEVDFGALEFCGAGCVWRDRNMVEYASDPKKDIHRDQAAAVYLLPTEEVTKEARYAAKNKFVFPTIYGSYYVNCAKNLWAAISELKIKTVSGVPLKKWLKTKGVTELGACDPKQKPKPGTFEAVVKAAEDGFYHTFPEFAKAKDRFWQRYCELGWFPLVTGFSCRGVFSRNFVLNAVIQGPMFHCLLWSLCEQDRAMRKAKMGSRLVVQIHDCGLGDVPEREAQDYLHLAKDVMTERIRREWDWILTPFKVEVDVTPEGGTWADKEPWAEAGGVWRPKSGAG